MLKEVGASGQISLGKKYAGQLFDMQIAADGAVTLIPVKVVPMAQEEPAVYKMQASPAAPADTYYTPQRMARKAAAAARSPAETLALHAQWEDDNKDAIEAMNLRISKIGSMARRIHEWRQEQTLREAVAGDAPGAKDD